MKQLTNSARRKFYDCPRAYKLAYVEMVRPAVPSDALAFGTAFHSMLETYWAGLANGAPSADDLAKSREAVVASVEDEYTRETLQVLFEGYANFWGYSDRLEFTTEAVELGYTAPLMNPDTGAASRTWVLAGKIDAVARRADGSAVIVEHKTTSCDIGPGSDYWTKLAIDGQVSGYYVGAQAAGIDARDCLYDVIRKPTIRPGSVALTDENGCKVVLDAEGARVMKKDGTPRQTADAAKGYVLQVRPETPAEWRDRLAADVMANPHKYFARQLVARSEDDLVDYLFDMWMVGRSIADSERLGRFPRNPAACDRFGTCEYFPVCAGFESIDNPAVYRKIETPNPELA